MTEKPDPRESTRETATDEGYPPLERLLSDDISSDLQTEMYSFDAPWQARSFGLVVASIRQSETFDWDQFQSRLIGAIEEAPDQQDNTRIEQQYYQRWIEAFETLLVDSNILTTEEIDSRANDFVLNERTAEEFVEGKQTSDH